MDLVQRGGEMEALGRLYRAAENGEGGATLITGGPGTGKSAVVRALAEHAAARGAVVLSASASRAEAALDLGVVGQLLSGAGEVAGELAGELAGGGAGEFAGAGAGGVAGGGAGGVAGGGAGGGAGGVAGAGAGGVAGGGAGGVAGAGAGGVAGGGAGEFAGAGAGAGSGVGGPVVGGPVVGGPVVGGPVVGGPVVGGPVVGGPVVGGPVVGGPVVGGVEGGAAVDFARLWWAVRNIERAAPVVVTVDDVQYADERSARFLLYLAGRLGTCRILLVLAGHPSAEADPAPALYELLHHPRCRQLPLRVLDESGVAEFVGAHAADWHRVCGGNPRLLRALVEDYRLCGPMRTAGPVPGAAFKRAVAACLRKVAPAVAETARALAVLRDAATLSLLARFLGQHERAVGPALDDLQQAGFLEAGRFRHEGMRAAVLEELSAAESAWLHGRAAELLYQDGAPVSTVAHRLLASDARHEPWAVPVLTDAARQALHTGHPEQAAACLRAAHRSVVHRSAVHGSAAHRGAVDDRQASGLLADLARAEWETDPARVTRHLPSLVRELEAGRLDARQADAVVGLLLWHGRPEQAAQALTALDRRPGASRDASARLWAWIEYAYPGCRRADGGARHATAAATGSLDGAALHRQAQPPGAHEPSALGEQILQNSALQGAPPAAVAAGLTLLLHTGDARRAAHWCQVLLDESEGAGPRSSPARRAVVRAVAALAHCRLRDHARAAEHAGAALALLPAEAWGAAIGVPLAAAVLAAAGRGAHEEAAEYLRTPVPDAVFRSRAAPYYLFARGSYHLAVGRQHAALGDFYGCRDLMAGWGIELGEAVPWRSRAARALLALERPGQARALLSFRPGDTPAGGAAAVAAAPLERLTQAEWRVAVLAAEGCTNRAIAARLFVTPSTVEQHLTRVFRKLSLRSRTELAALSGLAVPGG